MNPPKGTDRVEKFVRFYRSGFGRKVLRKEASFIAAKLKGCKRVLEVGCGIGRLARELKKANVFGLDNSWDMLIRAKRSFSSAYVQGTAERLGFRDRSFDAVYFVTSLEFVPSYRRAIREAHRVTKENGKILILMLNPSSPSFREGHEKANSYFHRIRHTHVKPIQDCLSSFYRIGRREYFLRMSGKQIRDKADEKTGLLTVLAGRKRNSRNRRNPGGVRSSAG